MLLITILAVRDSAENMKKAFREPDCYIDSINCIIHVLQLVIGDGLFSLASVKSLILMVRKVVTHAQLSNNFYAELFRQERMQMQLKTMLSLIMDVIVRW